MNEQNHDSLMARVFDTVVEWMKRDPQLRRFCSEDRQWRTWDGTQRDAELPTLNEMPCIRLTPRGDVMAWAVMGQVNNPSHSMTMNIDIETWVPGSNVRPSMELFEAILESLFPVQDTDRATALAEAMAAVGVSRRELLKAAFGDVAESGYVYGKGLYQLTFYLKTPVT